MSSPFAPVRRSSLPIALLVMAAVLAACASGGGVATPSPTGAPTAAPASGAAPCETAPQPADMSAWQPPSTTPPILPVPVSSQVSCGRNRFLFSFLDAQNTPIAAPDRTASVAFYDLGRDPAKVVSTATGTFVWGIKGTTGVYVTAATFPEAGVWGAEFTTAVAGGPEQKVRFTFNVVPKGSARAVGEKAPASQTPTLASVGGDVARISTDQHPDQRFYQTSVADAVASGKPFVLAFATPKFCTSGQCGPTLDVVKPLIDEFPTVTFINVEPYQLTWDGTQLTPVVTQNALTPVPAVSDWGITTEPWIFVVDRTGTITGSFEGIVGSDELRAAVAAVK